MTDSSNEVVLEVSKPSSDVRFYQDQLIRFVLTTASYLMIEKVMICGFIVLLLVSSALKNENNV